MDILKDRFGKPQEVIDLHYHKLINLPQAISKTSSLRGLIDGIERHIRSLEVLKQNINQDVFVSMIRSKLPEDVLLQLEIRNGAKNKWTVENLRARLHEHVTAREHAEKKDNLTNVKSSGDTHLCSDKGLKSGPGTHFGNRRNRPAGDQKTMYSSSNAKKQVPRGSMGSAEALMTTTHRTTPARYYDQCRYCEQRHWSDECPKYRTVEERKRQLKDSCYKCLKVGHMSKDCRKGKVCVHCGEVNVHHRNLCPKKFKSSISSAHLTEEIPESRENLCVLKRML